jgi:SAM-dependent methyltransferase
VKAAVGVDLSSTADQLGGVELESVPCDLCGSDTPDVWFRARDTSLNLPYVFVIVRCRSCGLAYVNPRPTPRAIDRFYGVEYFEDFTSGRLHSPKARRLFKAVYNRITGRLASEIEALPPGRVLDVGCGDGRYLSLFRERGWEAFGVDPSRVAIERAKSLGLKVFHGSLPDVGLPTAFFDLAIMRYTIENMHNPSRVLQEVHRVLKPNGRLFLAAPMIDCLFARASKQYSSYVDAPRHLYLFTVGTLSRMLQKHGFCVTVMKRVPTAGVLRDICNRLTGGRFRWFFSNLWWSRLMWTAELPLALGLAYVGINRGNVELIAEKVSSEQLDELGGRLGQPGESGSGAPALREAGAVSAYPVRRRSTSERVRAWVATTFPTRARYIRRELKDCATILDLGCGEDSPVQYGSSGYRVGVDIFLPSLQKARAFGTHHAYVRADLRHMAFRSRSVDIVVLGDVVEHLTKEDARPLLAEAERIARRKVLVATPNGYLQHQRQWVAQNPFAAHLSGWTVREFTSMGYEVRGLQGLRWLWRPGHPRLMGLIWKAVVYCLLQPIAYHFPHWAHDLLAVKYVDGPHPGARDR